MAIRPITDTYAVSPQISAEDLPAIAAAGFRLVICNRPDAEVPPSHQAAAIGAAAAEAGLRFEVLELTQQTITPDAARAQSDLVANAGGPVLAYCASGTRCSIIWAMGQVGQMSVDEIIARITAAGYDPGALRLRLEMDG